MLKRNAPCSCDSSGRFQRVQTGRVQMRKKFLESLCFSMSFMPDTQRPSNLYVYVYIYIYTWVCIPAYSPCMYIYIYIMYAPSGKQTRQLNFHPYVLPSWKPTLIGGCRLPCWINGGCLWIHILYIYIN